MTRTVLVARLDNAGDVLLQGPLVRAVAHGADRVVLHGSGHRPHDDERFAEVLGGFWRVVDG